MTDNQPENRTDPRQRPTEPLPASFRPFWIFLMLLFVLVAAIALTAFLVDRAVYG